MKFVIVFVLAALLTACGASTPTKSEQEAVAPSAPLTGVVPTMADTMIAKADALFNVGRLLEPEQDNAYLYYRAALMLEPKSSTAMAGMQAIMLAELEKVNELMAKGRLAQAQRQLKQCSALFPGEPSVERVQVELDGLKKKRNLRPQATVKVAEPTSHIEVIKLDGADLRARNESVKSLLVGVALQIKHTHQGLMIYARSDAEGRWIYKQMREAVTGYRIRGDIRIGGPELHLLEPFE
ncbi:hypothetical protein [Agaribacterium sp. ZY112]|uniref:hypothetical protein n=1 Tax=Agaribacterium sp. ZY112 TaxID=3233574 RepID=UPI00352471E1